MKAAVVGGGSIGRVHADSYRNAGVAVVAVVDPVEAAGRSFAEAFDARWYPDLTALLASEDRPDVVSVCTPPAFHRALAEEALAADVAVLCEKPMAHSLADARAMHGAARAAAERGVLFAMGYCHRFQPEVEFLKGRIDDGAIGAVRTFRNEFSGQQDDIERRWFGRRELAGGGVLLDAGIHSIDLFRYLCGEIVDAAATLSTELDGVPLEVEHTASLSLLSATGVIGAIDCSWKSPTGRAVIEVAGSRGALRYDYFTPGIVTVVAEDGTVSTIDVVDTGARFDRQLAAFVEAVRAGEAPRADAFDGLVGVAVVDAAYARAATRPVPLPEGV